MHTELLAQKDKLDDLFHLVQKCPIGDPVQVHLTHYLCVRVCGFLERSIRQIYYEHARRRSAATIATFVSKRLARLPNPKSTALCQLAGQFSPVWATDLEAFLGEERKDAVDSIVNNRNNIAHGNSVTFGLASLRDWYKGVLEVVEFLEQQTS
jgi:hypothetical protein